MFASSAKIFLVFLVVPSAVVALQCYCSGSGAQGCTNDGFCTTEQVPCTSANLKEACIKVNVDTNGIKGTVKGCGCASQVIK